MQEAYQNLMDQQQLSLSFEVPIYQWGRGSFAVEAVLADQRRILKNIEIYQKNFELEIAYQVKRLKLLEQHVMISAKADTIAQRRFDVSKDRYLIGKIDVTNLFIAQNEKDSARRNRIQTLLDYWAAYYRLRRLTLFDFEAGKPLRRTAEVNQ
jgi:outer membrane protein TolC